MLKLPSGRSINCGDHIIQVAGVGIGKLFVHGIGKLFLLMFQLMNKQQQKFSD